MVQVNDKVRVLQGRNSGGVGVVKRVNDKGDAFVDFGGTITVRDDFFDARSGHQERDGYWVPNQYMQYVT